MHAENPGPDNDTMLTLIETNDQLSIAMSQHQRAVLQARKTLGLSAATPPNAGTPSNGDMGPFAPPPGPPPPQSSTRPAQGPPPRPRSDKPEASSSSNVENPFNDPPPPGSSATKTHNPPFPEDNKKSGDQEERLGIEPYHPGFNATPSYANRQNSAVGGVKMSSAMPEQSELSSEDEDEEDRYKAEPVAKAPIYRY